MAGLESEAHRFSRDKNQRFYRAKDPQNTLTLVIKTERFFGFLVVFDYRVGYGLIFFYFQSTCDESVTEIVSKKKIFHNNHLAIGCDFVVPLRQSLFKFK
jgi:hypothetical protein